MDDLNEKIERVFADLGIRCAYNMPSFWANGGKDYVVIPTRYAKGYQKALEDAEREITEVLSEQPEQSSEIQDILEYLDTVLHPILSPEHWNVYSELHDMISMLPYAQPEPEKYEYHYDHTDCIWYRPEARNRCPVTCAQYRDGWNDAMNYIFRDGKGYRPYRRDEQYGE